MSKKLLTLIPSTVQITNKISYEVVFIDNFSSDKQVGECRPDSKQIVLKKGESPTETYKTFLHECIHAVSFEYMEDCGLTERQVMRLEEALYKTMKLNKVLDKLFK